MRHSLRNWLYLGVLLLLLVGILVLPTLLRSPGDTSISMALGPEQASAPGEKALCDIGKGPCRVELDKGQFAVFSLGPQGGIPAMTPVRVQVEFSQFEALEVQLRLEGKSMYMGRNQLMLQKNKKGIFAAETVIPACDMDANMVWLATFHVEGVEGSLDFPFEFLTKQ